MIVTGDTDWEATSAGGGLLHATCLMSHVTFMVIRISSEDRLSRPGVQAGARRSVVGAPANLGSNSDLSGSNAYSGELGVVSQNDD